MTGSFEIKTSGFEGPLELLLNLIESRKLSISDVSLAAVTDEYVAYVEKLGGVPIAESSQFILVASTLLLIKSKSLLPALDLSTEEESDMAELERRLKLYQKFRALSRALGKLFGANRLYPGSRTIQNEQIVFVPTSDLSLPALAGAMQAVLQNLPKQIFTPQAVIEKVISLEEMIDRLAVRISSALSLSFREWSGMGKAKKAEVIVSFLAMLELVKRGSLSVAQQAAFSDILIENERVDTPRYGTSI